MIHQALTLKMSLRSTKNVLLNDILLWLMMLRLHQIRDEKLQYDINRKAAEVSALSSGKIDKYEYLTVNEILTSNHQQIIEQAKFTYSLLGKAFEKQIKTIEDQGEKQIKAIQDQGQVKTIKKYIYDNEDTPLISKQKEIFNELVDERFEEITDLDKKKLIAMM